MVKKNEFFALPPFPSKFEKFISMWIFIFYFKLSLFIGSYHNAHVLKYENVKTKHLVYILCNMKMKAKKILDKLFSNKSFATKHFWLQNTYN
jgi:hypothetical protein